ncbi:MAG: cobalamin B12-binding domain-containing protein [Planctomycetes bacterium]|nr:cobalamin B12-binding domain-containing protein [Planctomycetota bacterium]
MTAQGRDPAEAAGLLARLADLVVAMDVEGVRREAEACLAAGLSPTRVISEGLSAGMRSVGEKFKAGEVYMPEVLVSCDVYYKGLEAVRPHIVPSDGSVSRGKMILGTIHGDIHTVGKDVAVPVFQAAGYDVVDLGVDVSDDAFVDAIQRHRPDVVGLGTYMTSTFMHAGATVETIRRAGLRERVRIICGGPAVDPAAARRMGADDASDDAWEAVGKIGRLVECLRAGAGRRAS